MEEPKRSGSKGAGEKAVRLEKAQGVGDEQKRRKETNKGKRRKPTIHPAPWTGPSRTSAAREPDRCMPRKTAPRGHCGLVHRGRTLPSLGNHRGKRAGGVTQIHRRKMQAYPKGGQNKSAKKEKESNGKEASPGTAMPSDGDEINRARRLLSHRH